MYQDIERAIRGRNLIRVNYPPGVRVVEPHTYGLNTDGNELLSVYQVRDSLNKSAALWHSMVAAAGAGRSEN